LPSTTAQQSAELVRPVGHARHRLVRALVALASVLAFLSIFAIWVERQALNTNDWVDTSGRLLQNPTIRNAVANYLVDQVYANVNVKKEVGSVLPNQVQQLAGPASAGLRQVAGTAADQVLKSSTAQQLWQAANRNAHEQLLAVLGGGSQTVSTQGGTVTLNLGSLVNNLVSQVGIGPKVSLPPTAGQIRILRSNQLSTAQNIAKGIRGLSVVLVLLTLGFLSLAIYLSPPGERWVTVFYCSIALVAAGFAVIVARHIAGQIVVDQLVTDPSAKAAGNATWSVGTSLMVSIATTVIVLGILFAIAAWIGSPVSSARSTREVVAPFLQQHAGYVYGALGIVLGSYFLIAPTHGVRSLLTTLALGAMAAVGIHRLQRQTAVEFPSAHSADTLTKARARIIETGRSLTDSTRRMRLPEAGEGTTPSIPETRIDHLERLAALHEKGILSDQELASEKARILGENGSS
jgi:hypothetical protein